METPYDAVPYPGYAYTQTHPDRIATLARLTGFPAADPKTCRVLEVGCGDGANLIPMALGLPHATFRGFDLAPSPIARANAAAAELGVSNVSFEACDLLELPDRAGEFDYIIAHGFYSWVPQVVRDKLMALCRASLSPNGIAFISYNTMPGGHIRRMVREMLLFHVANAPDPKTKIAQAQAVLGFLSSFTKGDDEYEALLKAEFERAQKYDPGYFFHDDLAPISDPFYLHEFVAHAEANRLQFLGDLNSSFVYLETKDEKVRAAVDQLRGNPVGLEQYLDFARCRRFRQTLICHQGHPVSADPDTGALEWMFVSSSASPVNDTPDLAEGKLEEFRAGRNAWLRTDHPVLKAVMVALREAWPGRLAMEPLRAAAAKLLGVAVEEIPEKLLQRAAYDAFAMRVADLHVMDLEIATKPGPYPRSSAMARWQAPRGTLITNLMHATAKVDEDVRRQLLGLADGTRDWEALGRETGLSDEELAGHLYGLARLALLEQ